MNGPGKKSRYSTDKIAFLGLFVLAVLIARIITTSRSATLFSGPITLNGTGLSISIPLGNGWTSDEHWNYRRNAYTLSSSFLLTPHQAAAQSICRYSLATAESDPPLVRFNRKAAALGGTVVQVDRIQTGAVVIDWAHIQSNNPLSDVFVGVVTLPHNRRLDIEIRQSTPHTELDLAERVFKHVADTLEFEDDHLLDKGSEVVGQVKNKGLTYFMLNQNRQDFYLIKDSRLRSIGFLMQVIVDSPNAELNIEAASLLYIGRPQVLEQAEFLQSDNSFDEILWKGESSSILERHGTEIALGRDGEMVIRTLGVAGGERHYQPGSATIPSIFTDALLDQMLEDNQSKIMVDLVNMSHPAGEIIPTRISLAPEAAAADSEAEHVFNVEFLDGQGFSEMVYLDSRRQTYKIVTKQRETYILDRTSLDVIKNHFPERRDWTLKKSKIPGRNQRQL